MKRALGSAAAVLLLFAGCGDPGESMKEDMARQPDAIGADLVKLPDLTVAQPADMTRPPDMTRPADMVVLVDMSVPDLEPPDLAVPPDLIEPPDLAVPPDLRIPPDLAKPPDLIIPPDLAVKPDLVVVPDMAKPPDLVHVKETVDVMVSPNNSLTFAPANVTIVAGDTVRWTWAGGGHSVTSGVGGVADNKFCSENDMNCANGATSIAGTVYSHTFNAAGNFPYYCAPHVFAGMTGTITVQ